MLTGFLGAALALPGRLLETLDPDRVAGRRATLRHDRATIEVRCARHPNGSRYSQTLVGELQQLPGVVWACVNAPINRVVIALDPTDPPTLPDLVAVVDRVESWVQRRERDYPYPDSPAEPAEFERWLGLGVNVLGAVLAGMGAVVRFTPLPAELAALVTAAEAQPRVRETLEAVFGRAPTDVGLALLNATGQSLSGGWLGLSVDAAQRVSALRESRAVAAGWRGREIELLADSQHAAAEAVVVERPRPLPPGPVESYAERAALLGLGAAGVALPATGNPRRAAALALAATPKAARVAREAFAAGLVQLLVKRGAVVADCAALRRLDRVDRIVLDAAAVGSTLEALAAVARRSGIPLQVASGQLLGTVRSLQSSGAVVLLVSRQAGALGGADIGIGVADPEGCPPWGAHVLVGEDLELAAVLIEACAAARQVSRRGVILSQAGSAVGGVGALIGAGWSSGPTRGAMLGVNCAAGAAFIQGSWSATQLDQRPPLLLPVRNTPWHAMAVADVLDDLGGTPTGLAEADVARRRRQVRRPQLVQTSLARAVMEELDNPLTPILAAGAVLSASLGSVVDAGLVAGVSALSALIGGAQRLHTDRAMAALLAHSAVTARVLRDGVPTRKPAEQLVPGDIVELRSGDVVPADCRVLTAAGLQLDESALTGESFPVTKTSEPVDASVVAERTSMLYEGTSVAAGRGTAVVVATGAATETGRSLAATRDAAPPTGVETRLTAITNTTLPIALASAGAVVAAGLLRGRPVRDSLGAGVSLAVASVPEGLPFLVSAAQLASARRLSKLGALVRNPRTIEALGRVDTLCFDKTGTLTEGHITLAGVASPTGALIAVDELTGRHRQILATALRATPRGRRGEALAHLTDRAVAEGAETAGVARDEDLPGWRRLHALPFEPSRGYHATLGALADEQIALISVKGAPETVLPRCTRLQVGGQIRALGTPQLTRVNLQVAQLAGQGYRVLAVAQRSDRHPRQIEDDDVCGLTLLGFVVLADPVRPAAAASIAGLRDAGVHIVMITGDHPATAEAIASRLNVLGRGRVITGPELDELDDACLDRVLPQVTVVARGTPAHKVRVVQAFQRLQRTVAMTGDGANDAPAIRLADVGIALGHRATPAARATADLVVTDDRLETIIAALVEGRAMWGSVRQALGILVGGNLGEIAFTVFGAALTGRSPLSARQLLLVNLLTDLAPAMAIALRAPDPDSSAALLAEGPEASLGAALTRDITTRALTTTAATGAAWIAARLTGRAKRARTVALAALVGAQLGQTVAIGGTSPAVLASSAGSAAVLAGIVQIPGLSQLFGCTPLGPVGWAIAGSATAGATAITALLPVLSQAALPGLPSTDVHPEVAEPPAEHPLLAIAGS